MIVLAAVGWRQRTALTRLQSELEAARATRRKLEPLRLEHERLVALQISPRELLRLQDDHAALGRLRAELQSIEAQKATRASAARSMRSGALASAAWQNVGRATPAATVQTLFWASAGGDLDTLGNAIALGPKSEAKAEAALARMPDAMRSKFPFSEQFAASMIAKTAGAARSFEVVDQTPDGPDRMSMQVQVEEESGTSERTFVLIRDAGGWKWVFPEK